MINCNPKYQRWFKLEPMSNTLMKGPRKINTIQSFSSSTLVVSICARRMFNIMLPIKFILSQPTKHLFCYSFSSSAFYNLVATNTAAMRQQQTIKQRNNVLKGWNTWNNHNPDDPTQSGWAGKFKNPFQEVTWRSSHHHRKRSISSHLILVCGSAHNLF
jgi:hypothetical protein